MVGSTTDRIGALGSVPLSDAGCNVPAHALPTAGAALWSATGASVSYRHRLEATIEAAEAEPKRLDEQEATEERLNGSRTRPVFTSVVSTWTVGSGTKSTAPTVDALGSVVPTTRVRR